MCCKQFNLNTWYVAERLSDTILKWYRERPKEKEEIMFLDKMRHHKKRQLSLEADEDLWPPTKKQRKGKTEEYVIENIVDVKLENGMECFCVKWKGYSDKDNTWEPIENLDNCPKILSAFAVDKEMQYCEALELLKQEIAFDNLLGEDHLLQRLKETEGIEMSRTKDLLTIKLLCMLTLDEEEESHAPKLVEETRGLLQLYVAARKRSRQLQELRKWEEHLNQVDRSKKLTVENYVDYAGPPQNFKYINHCIPGPGVVIPVDPPIGCECESCNCRSKSCCGMQGGLFAYTAKKLLRVATGTPIYECNKKCKCSQDCNNRVVQEGRTVRLCIFRTSNGRGWGVKAEQKIKQGQFISEYVGEVITFEEAEKRGREYDANGLTYLFDLDFNSAENPYTVDAANLGNITHFINHSCEPNLGVWAVWADCLDPNLPMIALFATCDIEIGEEVCFDYLQNASEADAGVSTSRSTPSEVVEADREEPSMPNDITLSPTDVSPTKSRFASQQRNVSHRNLTECRCDAINCRKYLF